jgi:hypothetical protein
MEPRSVNAVIEALRHDNPGVALPRARDLIRRVKIALLARRLHALHATAADVIGLFAHFV